jgi:hypothetical protein
MGNENSSQQHDHKTQSASNTISAPQMVTKSQNPTTDVNIPHEPKTVGADYF